MSTILIILTLLLALLLLNEGFRRWEHLGLFLFGILPFALIPFWSDSQVVDTFVWVKVFSVSAVAFLFCLLKILGHRPKRWIQILIYLALVINILEAVIADFSAGTLANVLNVMSGILLVFNLKGFKTISLEKDKKLNDLIWPGMEWAWILAYSVWNWAFVYLNYDAFSARHIAVLLAPILASLWNRGSWFQARAFTLAIYLIFAITFDDWISQFNIQTDKTEEMSILVAALSLAVGLWLTAKNFILPSVKWTKKQKLDQKKAL